MVEGISIAWWAALLGLALAIVLILKKLNATYALLLGAIVGCLVGGASLTQTVSVVVAGGQSVMGTIVRVLAAGILAGVMMESGAANRIAKTIVSKFGESDLFAGVRHDDYLRGRCVHPGCGAYCGADCH